MKIIEDYSDIIKNYNPTLNSTRNLLSKYEKVKIVGMRAEQLQRGAKPYVDFQNFNAIEIATKELDARKLPFMICRVLPNGQKEYWKLDDLVY